MRIVEAPPPNYSEIAAAFDLSGKRPIFCYGDAIYNPHRVAIDAPLMTHETRHSAQQEAIGGPAAWWDRYLAAADFRLSQEVEAYGAQLAAFNRLCRDRERRHRFAMSLAASLASPMYGSPCSAMEALALIRRNA